MSDHRGRVKRTDATRQQQLLEAQRRFRRALHRRGERPIQVVVTDQLIRRMSAAIDRQSREGKAMSRSEFIARAINAYLGSASGRHRHS